MGLMDKIISGVPFLQGAQNHFNPTPVQPVQPPAQIGTPIAPAPVYPKKQSGGQGGGLIDMIAKLFAGGGM